MDYKEFEAQPKYDAMAASVLVNPTKESKSVLWNGKENVIEAGEEKAFPNYVVRNFLKHTEGLKLQSEVAVEEPKKREQQFYKEVEIMCGTCNKLFKREQDLKAHLTKGCK